MTVATRRSWSGGWTIDFQTSGGAFDPVIVPLPASTAPSGAVITAVVVDSTAVVDGRTVPSVRTASKARDRYRVTLGGNDVTIDANGSRAPQPTYSLVEPLLYGSGSLQFPGLNAALQSAGVAKFAPVKVQRVDADDNVVATDYIGFVSDDPPNGRDWTCTLGGQATGRAAMVDRPMVPFPTQKDIGVQAMVAVSKPLRLPIGDIPTTGIKMLETGGAGSQLDFLTDLLAKSTTKGGAQWTIMPDSSGRYQMTRKNLTHIDASVYIDGFRVVESLRRDFTEEPNRVWASSVGPDGRRIRFAVYPGLTPASGRPAFPGTLSPGDSGSGVVALTWRLFAVGYLDDRPGDWTTDADDPITAAIEDLQGDADLSVTGVVNSATWDALFDPDITNYSLRNTHIEPAAQRSYTYGQLRNASGTVVGHNPAFDPTRPLVDVTVDMGTGFTRQQVKQWAKRELADDSTANWVGTVTVNTGAVIDGEHNPGDPLTTDLVRDARSIKPGHNLWLPNWDGGTLVHVSGVTVSPGSVEFAVDTRARDTMKVWEVIARNRESRKSPARQWIAQNRRSGLRDDTGAFYDGSVFGKVAETPLDADEWTVIPTPGGRSGLLNLIDTTLKNDPAAFALAIFGKQVDRDWCNRKLGDPFDGSFEDRVQRNQETWQDNRGLVDVWGGKDQPCGYFPRQHTDASGTVTDAPITGRFRFKAGTPYLCQGSPVLWVAIRPKDVDSVLDGGRILDLLLDDGAS